MNDWIDALSARPELITLLAADLYVVLTRARDIEILVKRTSQRQAREQKEVERGLLRSLLLELFLFVPTSVVLVLMVVGPLLMQSPVMSKASPKIIAASYGLLGVASYGFPFATLRRVVTKMALNTLQQFASVVHQEASPRGEEAPETRAGSAGS
jgi:hypothetical protein